MLRRKDIISLWLMGTAKVTKNACMECAENRGELKHYKAQKISLYKTMDS